MIAFHLLDRREVDFSFERTTRFLDLEGGAEVVAEPAIIGKRYREALERYLSALEGEVRRASVDYHAAFLGDRPDDVLSSCLAARMAGRQRR